MISIKSEHWRAELANTLTHGIGVLASVAAFCVLVIHAAQRGDPWEIVGVSIFGATLIFLYLSSTIYHGTPHPARKARLKVIDHCAIYLLIAGSYTPFMLTVMRGAWGWSLFGVIWGLALAGIVFKILFIDRFPVLSTVIYILMGWLIVVAIVPMIRLMTGTTLLWLVLGGVTYTGGTLFYHNKRVPHAHAIWHMFVLLGSACHAIAVATAMNV